MKIGLISGHRIPGLIRTKETVSVETAYGSVTVELASVGEHTVFFINRHGEQATLPPHKINYRANIEALSSSHVDCVLAVSAVGSLKNKIKPGDFVIPHDFIDCTKSRRYTFFDEQRIHVDMANPYCPALRETLIETAATVPSTMIHDKGVYLTTEGPRLETVTEIQYFSQFADIVGMTGVPEVVLAREKEMCYASLCIVCNMAAGLQKILTAEEITRLFKKQEPLVNKILRNAIESLTEKRTCSCRNRVSKAML